MGVFDIMDYFLGSYRPIFGWKKWYWSIIIIGFNISVSVTWSVLCEVESKPLTLLNFRDSVTLGLLKYPVKCRLQISVIRIAVLPKKVRFDDVRVSAPRGKCIIFQKNTRNMCQKK